jgi:hypothetical protein
MIITKSLGFSIREGLGIFFLVFFGPCDKGSPRIQRVNFGSESLSS